MLKSEIGKTSGEIWKFLGKNGKTPLATIAQEMKLKPEITTMAIGWLAREEKVHLSRETKTTYVHLTDEEVTKYKYEQATSERGMQM
jgi:Mn-dependent DtxR family transcriptional regulator